MTKPDMLDDLFELARDQSAAPDDALMDRILADAADVTRGGHAARVSVWDSFLEMIGGWPTVGGLAAAGVAGIWVGVAPPETLTIWTADLIGTPVTIDLLSDTSGLFSQGQIDG